MKLLTLLLLPTIVYNVHSANILGVFPLPSPSHHILGSALLKELAVKGHKVTMISPYPFEKKIENYTDIYLDGVLEYKEGMWVHWYKNILALLPKIIFSCRTNEVVDVIWKHSFGYDFIHTIL